MVLTWDREEENKTLTAERQQELGQDKERIVNFHNNQIWRLPVRP